ncbi:Hsp20/alpha crystallin family protein [Mycolicibacter terrae]|uniref:Heat-shock protein Hsp20 n=2 Tax=Mycolicibacter TaxID=1073531 RepID=A0A1A2P019_MYCSD|nr:MULTISPECIES: Hsp20/alpha crystallin family protein [Mycolicibacter]OBH20669.1 heat-shock protein Hsp20 [Mycolicibacter sinensis]OBI34577.1 heat-shock protein Hsp20 [Mycolicibacter sinensis]RRR44152.1 Hsp20/alpha crystallin family protein [Mycolicibacter terrae]
MSTLTLWQHPFDTDRWVRDFFGPATASAWRTPASGFFPAAEITKDGDDAVVRLELPGIDVDKDVTVELDGGRLVVHGERRDEYAGTDPADAKRTLREVRYGSFRRSFAVPAHITGDAITASYDAGVLTVRVAGVYAGTEPRRIAITK